MKLIKFKAIIYCLSILLFLKSTAMANVCKNKRFNINSNDANPYQILKKITQECSISFIIKDSYAKETLKKIDSIYIHDASLDNLLKILLEYNNLYYHLDNSSLEIAGLQTKMYKLDYINSIRESRSILNSPDKSIDSGFDYVSSSDVNEISSKESFDYWGNMIKEITWILNAYPYNYKADEPIINTNAGIATITATKKQHEKINEYLNVVKSRLDRQVLIEITAFSVALDSKNTNGIDWSSLELSLAPLLSPLDSISSSAISFSFNLNEQATLSASAILDFLKTQGEVKVIANPKILTMNNQPAIVSIGETIWYQEETENTATAATDVISVTTENKNIFVGTLLNITPQISDRNEIMLRINPSFSYIKENTFGDTDNKIRQIPPDMTTRKLSTVAKLSHGGSILIGGLIKENSQLKTSGIPILKDIPILGYLFGGTSEIKTSEELVFIIKATSTKDLEKNPNYLPPQTNT